MTPDQIFENLRRASMSTLQMQQEMVKQWTQQWPWPVNAASGAVDWSQRLQKRWLEFASESLNRHRESLDAMYKLAVQVIEQSSRLSETKNPEDYRRDVEELRNKTFEIFKEQSEAQLREFQKTVEKWFDVVVKV
jgi:hypothetical protein